MTLHLHPRSLGGRVAQPGLARRIGAGLIHSLCRPATGRPVMRLARFAARPNDAAGLDDRRLADIGLSRHDIPDHRGWRR